MKRIFWFHQGEREYYSYSLYSYDIVPTSFDRQDAKGRGGGCGALAMCKAPVMWEGRGASLPGKF